MRVAVVTPYYKEPEEILRQCHESVLAQTYACDHSLVSDGFPNPVVSTWKVEHFTLPKAHADAGNMGRVVGSISAFARGYDAVAFLDADNWYDKDHIRNLVDLQSRTGAAVCIARRSMHRLDGSYMFEDDKSDGRKHVDTNCIFLTRAALPLVARWAHMPRQLWPVGDSVYWSSIKTSGLPLARLERSTVHYRTTWESDYRRMGEVLPEGCKNIEVTDRPFRWFKALPAAERWRIWREFGFPLRRRSVARLVVQQALSSLSPFSVAKAKR